MKLISIITILVLVLAAIPVFAGCGKVAAYADPATENILIAMNNGDYASFSKDFNDTMKSELPEDVALEVVFQKIDGKMMVVGLWFN